LKLGLGTRDLALGISQVLRAFLKSKQIPVYTGMTPKKQIIRNENISILNTRKPVTRNQQQTTNNKQPKNYARSSKINRFS
jgi:hypothetical protein